MNTTHGDTFLSAYGFSLALFRQHLLLLLWVDTVRSKTSNQTIASERLPAGS
jgi:hypothetical protein